MWMGLFAHSQTPKGIYERLVGAVNKVAKDPELEKKLFEAGFYIAYKNPQEFSNLISNQWELFGRIIKETDLKTD